MIYDYTDNRIYVSPFLLKIVDTILRF